MDADEAGSGEGGRVTEKTEEIRARGQEASSNLHFGDGSVTSGVESVHETSLEFQSDNEMGQVGC